MAIPVDEAVWSERVTLVVKLPPEVAATVRQMEKEDPDFFSRVVLYGATRRGIHRHLKEEAERVESEGEEALLI